jgi:hypothetical protein
MQNDCSHDNTEYEDTVIKNVAKYGCHLVLINADNYLPAFVYSIGLYENFSHPEIICFGLNIDVMANLINKIRDLAKDGKKVAAGGACSNLIEDYDVHFLNVNSVYYNYIGYATWFYKGLQFPTLQLVWPDKNSFFPWEANFSKDLKFRQPLLDRNLDFKFYEERSLGVYTTKQAFNGAPILFVYHNDDGDWQFHTSSNPNLQDAILVCLEEITKLDGSINDIYHLQYGWSAWRGSIQDGWQYAPSTVD